MTKYYSVVDEVVEELENYDSDREKVIQLTRKLNRSSGRAISKLVRNEDYMEYLTKSRGYIKDINALMRNLAPVISWSTTNSGTEEYSELELLHAILNDQPLPSPEDLMVPSWIWITGLGDVVGELRRVMLSSIIDDDLDNAQEILDKIMDLYDTIVGLEFSKSLVSNLRRKIDVARTLVDRCQSDFANAVIHKQSKGTDYQD